MERIRLTMTITNVRQRAAGLSLRGLLPPENAHHGFFIGIRHTLAIAVVASSLALGGCSQVTRPEQAQAGEKVDSNVFLHEHLPGQSMVTVAEAYRAMVMLAEGQDKLDSFAAREEYLLARQIARPAWKLQRDMAIDRGSVAYMVMRILNIRGGVNANVYGRLGIGDRRYAVRELAYRSIMTDAPPYRLISGAELVDVLGNADAAMADRAIYAQERTDINKQAE
jgi:hypothetical protein